jgi:2-dehydro-3-deoxyphosphogluconate aldolase/(4S)-4-hydroxy-2-oxoglutarate aldolase
MRATALDFVATAIETDRVIAIVRIDGAEQAARAGRALVAGGVRVVEFSLAAEGALDAIGLLRESDGQAIVGAGTVLDVAQARAAAAAGAQYLVAPGFDPEVLDWACGNDLLHVPGALSPTEIVMAARAGARLVKLFPARAFGPGYIADLAGPLPEVRLIATGGVSHQDAAGYLSAGAAAVALGSALADAGRSDEETTQRARQITELVAESRRDT